LCGQISSVVFENHIFTFSSVNRQTIVVKPI
jgi:hypothetical protein